MLKSGCRDGETRENTVFRLVRAPAMTEQSEPYHGEIVHTQEVRGSSPFGYTVAYIERRYFYMTIPAHVTVTVDRPLGSAHPNHPSLVYPVNYGYIQGILGGDGEEQDAYILGVDIPLSSFTGRVIAIIHRDNDSEDKWVVSADGATFTEADIRRLTHFQEQYFRITIQMM